MHVTSEAAKKAIDGALKKAESTDTRMCIAVVDSGGALKAFYRMSIKLALICTAISLLVIPGFLAFR